MLVRVYLYVYMKKNVQKKALVKSVDSESLDQTAHPYILLVAFSVFQSYSLYLSIEVAGNKIKIRVLGSACLPALSLPANSIMAFGHFVMLRDTRIYESPAVHTNPHTCTIHAVQTDSVVFAVRQRTHFNWLDPL